MMKITSPTPTIPRRRLCSALLLAGITLAFAPPSVRANDQVPFRALFMEEGNAVVQFPLVHITVIAEGAALHMGATTAVTDDQTLNLLTGLATATYTLTAANGDTLVLHVDIHEAVSATGATISGNYTATGGTGRFDGATGSGTMTGFATFTGATTSVGWLALEGTISSPGSLKE
jgi:hypothetical protein